MAIQNLKHNCDQQHFREEAHLKAIVCELSTNTERTTPATTAIL